MESAFIDFIVLLVISVVVSAILHFALNYYVKPGIASFCGKVVIGYLGGWLSPWVLGKWFTVVSIGNVDIISAIVGTLAILVFAVDMGKAYAPGEVKRPTTKAKQ